MVEGVEYTCGGILYILFLLACRAIVTLKPQEAIQCRNCGHRILYKVRTNARIFFKNYYEIAQQLEAR